MITPVKIAAPVNGSTTKQSTALSARHYVQFVFHLLKNPPFFDRGRKGHIATSSLVAALLNVGIFAPAHAKEMGDASSAIARLPVAEMCRVDGAHGLKFGDTSLLPAPNRSERLKPRIPLDARFAPFTKVALVTTEWSNQFYAATYAFDQSDSAANARTIRALAARMETAGWTRVDGDELVKSGAWDKLPINFAYFPPYKGEFVYFSDPADVNRPIPQGSYVRLNEEMGQVLFSCLEPNITKVQIKEAFGDLPPDAARPMPPVNPLTAAGLSQLDCASPDGLKKASAAIKPANAPRAYHYPLMAFDYRTRLKTWKMSQIEHKAKLTDEQAGELALSTMDIKKFEPAFNNMGAMVAILELVDKATAAEAAGNDAALCMATAQAFAANAALEKSWLPFWADNDARINAAAKKLGVRF